MKPTFTMKHAAGSCAPITVLMACYNGAEWLDQCVESVLSQTWTDFEFLVIDDGSTDNSGAILDSYAERDSRVRVIHKPNTGLADSLNLGLMVAGGEWIARIDADDVSLPTRLEQQLTFVTAHKSVSFVGGGLVEIDKFGATIAEFRYPRRHRTLVASLESMKRFPAHSTAFYRRSIVVGLGGYRARISRAEDYDLWLRLSQVGQLACITAPLVNLRIHPAQVSQGSTGQQQKVDARIALTSYWLRKLGAPDPVDAPPEDFAEYSRFLTARIGMDASVRHFARLSDLRSRYRQLKALLQTIRTPRVSLKANPRPWLGIAALVAQSIRKAPLDVIALSSYRWSSWWIARSARINAGAWIEHNRSRGA